MPKIESCLTACLKWSSLFYNTIARHERHERHECNTNAIQTARVQDEREEFKNFDFDKTHVTTYFQISILTIWQMKHYKERDNFILRITFSKCLVPMPKLHLKSASQKLNFVMTKAISKSYPLDCSCKYPCTFQHIYE